MQIYRKRIPVAAVDLTMKWQMKVSADKYEVMHKRKNGPNYAQIIMGINKLLVHRKEILEPQWSVF